MTMPTLISGDHKAQMSFNYSMTRIVIDNVDSQGFWHLADEHQNVQTMKIEGAQIINDLWQFGLSAPFIERTYLNRRYSGLGDITSSVSYEYLSDWNDNFFPPKALLSLQLKIPSGYSRAESELGGLDTLGTGFWSLGVGTVLTKSLGRWDLYSSVEVHHSFEKKVNNKLINGLIRPGNGSVVEVGTGHNWTRYRVGITISEVFEEPVHIESLAGVNSGHAESYSTATLIASYLADNNWSWSISYSDQTIIGHPINTSLGQSLNIQFQHRWAQLK